MQTGTLRIELTTGGALPVNDAIVRIRSTSGELLYESPIPIGSEGISRIFELDAPDIGLSYDPQELPSPYGLYNIEVLSGNFVRAFVNGVQVFAQREAILQIPMQPKTANFPSGDLPQTFVIPPNALRLPPQPVGDTSALLPQTPTSQLHAFPFIPEYVTVHLGVPTDFSARNVTVKFQDYIKNVASSEIYPTWPEESLKANIIAQISFVLNRVFTEWYRSRGYDFDITSTTAFDQCFVEGRNIFSNISRIVDDIFNVYIRKPDSEEPYFAAFCNGTTSKCDGLSQWGTVSLANDGIDAEGILEYYYGDVELVETDDIRGAFESYPGNPLRLGSRGEPVRSVQEQLNRIAINYPSITFIAVDGVFGESTERSVKQFQRIFNLTPDGIVGKATWYAISRVYVAVKELAELTSEGERADYASQDYPGRPLRLGDRGAEVLEIQLYLSTIALYNNQVKTVAIDGVFGESTLNSVVSFQRAYGIDPDGIVGKTTWERIVDVYNGIGNNVEVPSVGDEIVLQPYPGVPLRVGSQSNLVVYVGRLINTLSKVYAEISPVEVSDNFDEALSESVKQFQGIAALPETGVVDEVTWNYLNDYYKRVEGDEFADLGRRPYPGTVIKKGDRGANVSYIQSALERVRPIYNLPKVTVDGIFGTLGRASENSVNRHLWKIINRSHGIFGSSTESAVREFQQQSGLLSDGVVGKFTWDTLNSAVIGAQTPVEPRTVLATEESSADINETAPIEVRKEEVTAHKQVKRLGMNEAYERPLRVGSVGSDVEKMKKALYEKGYLDQNAVNGDIYGIATRRAVEFLQRDSGITPTGRVDEATWMEIFS